MNNDSDIEDNEVEMSIWNNEDKENLEFGYGPEKQSSNNSSPSLSIAEFTTLMNNTPLSDFDRQMDIDQILYSGSSTDLYSVLSTSPANSPCSLQGYLLDSMRADVSPDFMDAGTDSTNENLVLVIQIILKCLFVIKILKYTFQVNF